MAVNGTIAQTNWTDKAAIQGSTALLVKAIHIRELRAAVNALEGYVVNVNNCGCESCQDSCVCQSDKCQKCQTCQINTCQTCQSCESYNSCGGNSCSGNSCSSSDNDGDGYDPY